MQKYMLQFYDPKNYPPPSTHIYGLPLPTFEMLLQSTSIRIALYLVLEFHTFNHRAISTRGIESSFSDLSIVDITGTSCPKAYQIPKLMLNIILLNMIQQNFSKWIDIEANLMSVMYWIFLMTIHSLITVMTQTIQVMFLKVIALIEFQG